MKREQSLLRITLFLGTTSTQLRNITWFQRVLLAIPPNMTSLQEHFLDKIIQRNKKLELSAGYSESFMKSQWENCRIGYHGEDELLWQNA